MQEALEGGERAEGSFDVRSFTDRGVINVCLLSHSFLVGSRIERSLRFFHLSKMI